MGAAGGLTLGMLTGVVSSVFKQSHDANKLQTRLGDKLPSAKQARKALAYDPARGRARVLTSLLGLGSHHRGRLGAYNEMLTKAPDSKVSLVPDLLNYVPYVNAVAGLGTLGMDTVKADTAENKLAGSLRGK